MQPMVVGSGALKSVGTLGNALLDALPRDVLGRLAPSLELRLLNAGEALHESGEPSRHLVFPTSAVVSLAVILTNGEMAQAAAVGREGVVGLGLLLGGGASAQRAVVQITGAGIRLASLPLARELARSERLRDGLLRYCQTLLGQLAQNVVCGRLHPLEPRLCRWLLGTADRLRVDEIGVTQESIAWALGVRREAVTIAMHHLQAAGMIRNGRGRVCILDRQRLEAKACECRGLLREATSLHGPTVTALPVANDS